MVLLYSVRTPDSYISDLHADNGPTAQTRDKCAINRDLPNLCRRNTRRNPPTEFNPRRLGALAILPLQKLSSQWHQNSSWRRIRLHHRCYRLAHCRRVYRHARYCFLREEYRLVPRCALADSRSIILLQRPLCMPNQNCPGTPVDAKPRGIRHHRKGCRPR